MNLTIGLILGLATLAITLAGLLWRMSALTTTLTLTIKDLKEEVEELKKQRAALEAVPTLLTRVGQLEEALASITRTLRGEGQDAGLLGRIHAIERRISTPMLQAVRRTPSRPRLEEDEEGD